MRFKSKIDWWLPGGALAIVAVSFIPMFVVAPFDKSVMILMAVLFLIILIPPFFSISYIVSEDTLEVRTFWIRKDRYPINKIFEIRPTASALSAPASSLDRIAISFTDRTTPLVISPANKEEFIHSLTDINPSIKVSWM